MRRKKHSTGVEKVTIWGWGRINLRIRRYPFVELEGTKLRMRRYPFEAEKNYVRKPTIWGWQLSKRSDVRFRRDLTYVPKRAMKAISIKDTPVKQRSAPKKIPITFRDSLNNQELRARIVKAKMIDVKPLIITAGHVVRYRNWHVISSFNTPCKLPQHDARNLKYCMVSLAADFLEPDLWRLCLKNAWAAGKQKMLLPFPC